LIGKKGPEKTGMRLENQLMSRRTITKSGVAITLSSGQSREKKERISKISRSFSFQTSFLYFFPRIFNCSVFVVQNRIY